jgi:dihydropteroate synthase
MAILNVTPDSFSDGGAILAPDDAVRIARAMVEDGADVLDVGGESTRPGAEPVSTDVELSRVIPVIRALAERVGVPVSIDTVKAAVFAEAWRAGASMLNDVSALAADPALAAEAARTDAAVVLMHRRGDARTMSSLAVYDDVVREVAEELLQAVRRARAAGVVDERIALDPGLGFAKNPEHSFKLLSELDALRGGAFPLVVGPSRKGFLGAATGRAAPADRDAATAVVTADLARRGVECVRVHRPGFARDAIRTVAALVAAEGTP